MFVLFSLFLVHPFPPFPLARLALLRSTQHITTSLLHLQDLGNTNYCVFVPRLEFDRRTNAELVVSGLKNLSIPASVNDRNDIVVDGFKVRFFLPLSRRLRGGADKTSPSSSMMSRFRAPLSNSSTTALTTTARCSSTPNWALYEVFSVGKTCVCSPLPFLRHADLDTIQCRTRWSPKASLPSPRRYGT
jgi:hypothetical protein